MNDEYTLKKYYTEYLRNVQKVADSSVGHYLQAIRSISQYMVDKGVVQDSIYEIDNLQRLGEVRDILYADEEFVALNKRGHNMYSVGLNHYYKFASGEEFSNLNIGTSIMDTPVPVATKVKTTSISWGRSQILKVQAIESVGYTCEIDTCHATFTAKSTGRQYMEGHHAIPMRYQDKFANSLDVYANIISLCPICHRLLHYGIKEEKITSVRQIYHERADRLADSGLPMSEEDFEMLCL